ncbi:MAG TPA: M48 family metalloprotease [Chakrabartia sp.]|nr:M48 family metalloprotease [Chakrabartia sp.]
MAHPLHMFRQWGARLVVLLLSVCLTVQPALAQSILRDAETEAVFAEMSAPLIAAAGMRPRDVQIVLIQDKNINAFVAGGQIVYIHSGLIAAASNANEVQGVIAHELGHIAGGHVIRSSEGMKAATGITILSLLIGVAAMAAGAGEAGAGIMAAGQQAALGKFLAFNRTQESSADLAGASYLHKSGISGRGSVAFFKKLQNLEFRYSIPQDDSYARTHPLTGERIAVLEDRYKTDPAWNKPTDPALEARFQRIKAKLKGFIDPKQALIDYPVTDVSIPARYARAYAWHRTSYPQAALDEADMLIRALPHDPYFLELKGQILLESGRPKEALPMLREAVSKTGAQPLIAATFGHALIEADEHANLAEAERVLKAAVNKDNENPFAWYQLGVVYSRQGDTARAALASAEQHLLMGRMPLARASARAAMAGIKEGTPDWIRAADIAMVADNEMGGKDRKKK